MILSNHTRWRKYLKLDHQCYLKILHLEGMVEVNSRSHQCCLNFTRTLTMVWELTKVKIHPKAFYCSIHWPVKREGLMPNCVENNFSCARLMHLEEKDGNFY